jgi:hypothetical protein
MTLKQYTKAGVWSVAVVPVLVKQWTYLFTDLR